MIETKLLHSVIVTNTMNDAMIVGLVCSGCTQSNIFCCESFGVVSCYMRGTITGKVQGLVCKMISV